MRKFFMIAALAAILSTAGTGLVRADSHMDMTQAKGDVFIGFWDINAPVAVRFMLTDDWELMGGFGFTKPAGDNVDTGIALSAAATYRLIHGKRAHLGLRPRIFKELNTPEELLAIGADLSVEVEIASAVSVVAAHGIEYLSEDAGSETNTTLQTRTVTNTSVGFWVKLP